ncbi:serine/threonine-protein phosphatase [candidate division KSB1 bacterium]|nr:serine/threonine-protein phosphatase [candidate division KSB1 bacterium]RQW00868.1 MAG: serine/threonine-protein phosphatase [candidate division KSB1 bacterium]
MKKRKKTGLFRDFFGTIRQDLKETNIKTSLWRDLRAIYEFYLSPQERTELAAMGWFRRWLYRIFWFIINILKKLSPFRRLLLLLSIILLLEVNNNSRVVLGYVALFIVLILELKDKLLAHDELRAGRAVQAALRPESCPPLSGWETYLFTRSANDVGGDLIDCIKLSDEHFGFMVGDVSGKGLGAALLMAQLQASVHALASANKSLVKLVTQLNEIYCRGGLSNSFISFIYFDIKADSGKVNFVNAGHIPPAIIKNAQFEEWSKGGLALGLEQNTKYREETLTLNAGDFLVVYTDGVTEARNEKGDFWGEERFFKLIQSFQSLNSTMLGEKIVQAINAFTGNAMRSDDLTFLILKRT